MSKNPIKTKDRCIDELIKTVRKDLGDKTADELKKEELEDEPEWEDVEEIGEEEWLRAAATNPVFDILKDPEEDIYTLADGKPFNN